MACVCTYVNVSGPEYLAVDDLLDNRLASLLQVLLDDSLVEAISITSSHGEVREECESGDEGGQDMEKSFLLGFQSASRQTDIKSSIKRLTTGTLAAKA